MQHQLPARSTTFGVAAALILSLIVGLLAIGAGRGQAAGAPAKRTCSTAGLRFTDQRAGCTPDSQVSARSSEGSVTFTVRGGV